MNIRFACAIAAALIVVSLLLSPAPAQASRVFIQPTVVQADLRNLGLPASSAGTYTVRFVGQGKDQTSSPVGLNIPQTPFTLPDGISVTVAVQLSPGFYVLRWDGACRANAGNLSATWVSGDLAVEYCRPIVQPVSAQPSVGAADGWWYENNASGRGFAFGINAANKLFGAIFTYRDDGTPVWYMLNLTYNAADAARRYTGTVTEVHGGATLTGSGGNPTSTRVGSAGIFFADATRASIRLTIGDQLYSRAIYRFPIAGGSVQPAPAGAPKTGWYTNANQNGVGYFIEMQGANEFSAVFAYDAAGNPVWYTMGGPMNQNVGGGWVGSFTLQQFSGGSSLVASDIRQPAAQSVAGVTLSTGGLNPTVLTLPGGANTLSVFAW